MTTEHSQLIQTRECLSDQLEELECKWGEKRRQYGRSTPPAVNAIRRAWNSLNYQRDLVCQAIADLNE